MNPEACEQAFRHQSKRFRVLFWQVMKQHGQPLGPTNAGPKAVLSFVEGLMICPTEDAALTHIARDLEPAKTCSIIAGDVASADDIRNALSVDLPGQGETPFCYLAAILRYRSEAAIEKFGDSWS